MNYRFGPTLGKSGHVFRLWAPGAATVDLQLYAANRDAPKMRAKMERLEDGWWISEALSVAETPLYHFCIDGGPCVPDPASRFQPFDVHGPSMVVEPKRLVSETAGEWKGRPWEEVVLYEVHLGTFTPAGSYRGAEERLAYLAELGITAVELMPLSDFSGTRNWGYDGVLPFAPDSSYGTLADLQAFISRAHGLGLMVFLDVVYNHFGPEGNYLHLYAPSFFTDRFDTPWGAAIDFSQSEVRQFFIENAVYWLKDVGFDGLRLDAVHAIEDPSERHILEELCETVRGEIEGERYIHLVLENDANQARYLGSAPGKSYDAQWNDDAHHVFHVTATGECDGYYQDYCEESSNKLARSLTEGFVYQGEPSKYREGEPRGESSSHLRSSAFVSFLQNHDQIGNRPFGDRLTTLLGGPGSPEELKPLAALQMVLLLSPQIPMLFMGEEWGSTTPFYYFCDYEAELGRAVTEGRRREFAGFIGFGDQEARARIPDPNDRDTFEAGALRWEEVKLPEHKAWYDRTRYLLRLRRKYILPFLRAGGGTPEDAKASGEPHSYRGSSPASGLVLGRWEHRRSVLTLTANLSPSARDTAWKEDFFGSPGGAADATSICVVGDQTVDGDLARLGAWSVTWRLL